MLDETRINKLQTATEFANQFASPASLNNPKSLTFVKKIKLLGITSSIIEEQVKSIKVVVKEGTTNTVTLTITLTQNSFLKIQTQ